MYIGTEANKPDPYLLEDGTYYIEPQGIQVVNIENPYSPMIVDEWDGVVQSHNIMEADGYLYIIGSYQTYSNDGEEFFKGNEAQEVLNAILPQSIMRFFFIDGESVDDYRSLIASTKEAGAPCPPNSFEASREAHPSS